MTITAGSLFSGIGGIDLGLERAGMTVRWQVEIDDWCRRVLAKHWPDVPRYGDIRELSGHDLEPVDVLAGGFPCQPVSMVGKRLGQDDQRWLWPEFARLIRSLRPRYVLLENVTGLLSRGIGDVLGELSACGYDAEWDCVPAHAVGAPHVRDRVFVVAYPQSESRVHRVFERGLWAGLDRVSDWQAWASEQWPETRPRVRRVDDGLPDSVDRVTALGNAVVPQVVELIGRRIVAAMDA